MSRTSQKKVIEIPQGFIAARDASKRFSITSDYVSLLCRGGKIECTRIGRTWYVKESSIASYLKKMSSKREAQKTALSTKLQKEYRERSGKPVASPIQIAPSLFLKKTKHSVKSATKRSPFEKRHTYMPVYVTAFLFLFGGVSLVSSGTFDSYFNDIGVTIALASSSSAYGSAEAAPPLYAVASPDNQEWSYFFDSLQENSIALWNKTVAPFSDAFVASVYKAEQDQIASYETIGNSVQGVSGMIPTAFQDQTFSLANLSSSDMSASVGEAFQENNQSGIANMIAAVDNASLSFGDHYLEAVDALGDAQVAAYRAIGSASITAGVAYIQAVDAFGDAEASFYVSAANALQGIPATAAVSMANSPSAPHIPDVSSAPVLTNIENSVLHGLHADAIEVPQLSYGPGSLARSQANMAAVASLEYPVSLFASDVQSGAGVVADALAGWIDE